MTIEQLERELLRLSASDRARLARRLISSLEGEEELETAWYDEAEARLAQITHGLVREVPVEDVLPAHQRDG